MKAVRVTDRDWWGRLPRDPLERKGVVPHPLLPSLGSLLGLAIQKALEGGTNLTNVGAPLASNQSKAATPQAGNPAADMPSQFGRHRDATKRAATGLGRAALETPQHSFTKGLATPAPLSCLFGVWSRATGAFRVARGLHK
eukprot:7164674-Alexandrium_andersonii.AAC.1